MLSLVVVVGHGDGQSTIVRRRPYPLHFRGLRRLADVCRPEVPWEYTYRFCSLTRQEVETLSTGQATGKRINGVPRTLTLVDGVASWTQDGCLERRRVLDRRPIVDDHGRPAGAMIVCDDGLGSTRTTTSSPDPARPPSDG